MSGYQNYNNYYPGYPGDYYNSYNQYPAGKYRLVWEDVYKGLRGGGGGGGGKGIVNLQLLFVLLIYPVL